MKFAGHLVLMGKAEIVNLFIFRYKMVRHGRELNNLPNPKRFSLLKNTVKKKAGYNLDGLSTLNYSVCYMKLE